MPSTKPTKKAAPLKKVAKAAGFTANTNKLLATTVGATNFIGINSFTIRFNPAGGVGYYELQLANGTPVLLQQIDSAATAATTTLLANPKTMYDPLRQELVLAK